jgi:hypothetical protein
MRRVLTVLMAIGTLASAWATTLQLLSTDNMIQQSTAIVRARVTGSTTAFRGKDIFTYYQLQVVETLKAGPSPLTTVAVPGGAAGGLRQVVPGAPALASGQEYVIFLWTSKSGLTQVIGLSQGLFAVTQNAAGLAVMVRPAAGSMMVNRSGEAVADQPASMSLSSLRTAIQKLTGASN